MNEVAIFEQDAINSLFTRPRFISESWSRLPNAIRTAFLNDILERVEHIERPEDAYPPDDPDAIKWFQIPATKDNMERITSIPSKVHAIYTYQSPIEVYVADEPHPVTPWKNIVHSSTVFAQGAVITAGNLYTRIRVCSPTSSDTTETPPSMLVAMFGDTLKSSIATLCSPRHAIWMPAQWTLEPRSCCAVVYGAGATHVRPLII